MITYIIGSDYKIGNLGMNIRNSYTNPLVPLL